MRTALRLTRWLSDLALIALVVSGYGPCSAANIGPRRPIRWSSSGLSMSPTIPLGSVVDVSRVKPGGLKVGDVVTVKSPGGTDYTHASRIVQIPTGYTSRPRASGRHPDSPVLPSPSFTWPGRPHAPSWLPDVHADDPVRHPLHLLPATTELLCVWLLEDLEADEEEDMRPEGRASLSCRRGELIG